MHDGQIQLELDEDVRREVEQVLVMRLQDAVAGAGTRDALLAELDDQLEMRLPPVGKPRWTGACELNDPLTVESHLELLALITQAQRKDPKWQVEAISPESDDDAPLMEAWLTNKAGEYELNSHLYNVAYNTLRDPVGLLYVGWKQAVRPVRRTMYRDREFPNGNPIDGMARDPDRQYDAVVVQEYDIDHVGCDFRVPDIADVYLYPADAQSIQHAIGIGERMLLTEDQLLDGVEDYGYDEDRVEELIRRGPTHVLGSDGDLRERRTRYDGTDGHTVDRADGFYECFLWFGRLPKLRDADGALGIPEEYVSEETMAMICPSHSLVFALQASPYPGRPYIPFYMIRRPGRFYGKGAAQLLLTLQDEATALLQSGIDSVNLKTSPAFVAPSQWTQKYAKFSIYPGAVLPEDAPNELRVLEVGGDINAGLEAQGMVVQRGKGLVAAQGYGEMQTKVRKAAEVQNVLAATDAKFDLFLQNFQSSMEELAVWIVTLHLHFQGDELQEAVTLGGEEHQITAQHLRGRYRFIPTATSSTSTPEMRLQIAQAKQGVQMQFLSAAAQAPPNFLPLLWHGARQVLLDMGERQPEAWIGPEPQAPPQVPPELLALQQQGIAPQVQQQLMAGAPGPNLAAAAQGALNG